MTTLSDGTDVKDLSDLGLVSRARETSSAGDAKIIAAEAARRMALHEAEEKGSGSIFESAAAGK
jgi:hypothetical protein